MREIFVVHINYINGIQKNNFSAEKKKGRREMCFLLFFLKISCFPYQKSSLQPNNIMQTLNAKVNKKGILEDMHI